MSRSRSGEFMPQSDRLVEQVYDLVNNQSGEARRLEVARAAALAAQYRAEQLARKATQKEEKQCPQ